MRKGLEMTVIVEADSKELQPWTKVLTRSEIFPLLPLSFTMLSFPALLIALVIAIHERLNIEMGEGTDKMFHCGNDKVKA